MLRYFVLFSCKSRDVSSLDGENHGGAVYTFTHQIVSLLKDCLASGVIPGTHVSCHKSAVTGWCWSFVQICMQVSQPVKLSMRIAFKSFKLMQIFESLVSPCLYWCGTMLDCCSFEAAEKSDHSSGFELQIRGRICTVCRSWWEFVGSSSWCVRVQSWLFSIKTCQNTSWVEERNTSEEYADCLHLQTGYLAGVCIDS